MAELQNTQPTALITGSSRGIGAATARLLAQRGYRICINYLKNKAAADTLAEELNQYRPIVIQADVSKEEDVLRLFNTLDQEFGRL